MKAADRAEALTLAKFAAAEKHGKRQDETSQKRRVRDREPLVFGSLDLRDAYEKHVAGARMNAGLKKPVLHALIQFPIQIKLTPENEERMLRHAIEFVNKTHGGDAVFAARLDRDEDGRHTVDVFFSPKYEKQTKSKGAEAWISTTKHGKELALKHAEEIKRRSPKARDVSLTSPRAVGIAMQTELAEFFAANGLKLEPRREKNSSKPDRVDPETFKAREDAKRAKAEAEALRDAAERDASKILHEIEAREEKIKDQEIALSQALEKNEKEKREIEAENAKLAKAIENVREMTSSLKRALSDMSSVVLDWTEKLGLTVPREIKQFSDLEKAVSSILHDNQERIEELDVSLHDIDVSSISSR